MCSLIEGGLVATGSRIARLVVVIAARLVVVFAAIVVVVIRLVFGRRLLHSAFWLFWLCLCCYWLLRLCGHADTLGNSLVECVIIVIGRLLKKEVCGQFFVLVAGEVGLSGAVLAESKALEVLDGLHLFLRHDKLTGTGCTCTAGSRLTLTSCGHTTGCRLASSGHTGSRVPA